MQRYTVFFIFGSPASYPEKTFLSHKSFLIIFHCVYLRDIFLSVHCWQYMFCSKYSPAAIDFCFTQTLNVEYESPCLQSLIFAARDGRCYLLLAARLLCFTKEAGYCAPTFSFLSVYISRLLSPVHRQAVSAEAGTMSTPTNPEVKELSPVDFIQLQQYIECEYRQGGGRAGGREGCFLSA